MEHLHTYKQTQQRNKNAYTAFSRQEEVLSWKLVTSIETDEQGLLDCLEMLSLFLLCYVRLSTTAEEGKTKK